MLQPLPIQCPYCFEKLTLWLPPDELGEMVTDCEVCCRPWHLEIWMDDQGELRGQVRRS